MVKLCQRELHQWEKDRRVCIFDVEDVVSTHITKLRVFVHPVDMVQHQRCEVIVGTKEAIGHNQLFQY